MMQRDNGNDLLPLVSVIVATYRRKEELNRALKSLAGQTFRRMEIIVVDDNDEMSWNHEVDMIVNRFREEFPDIELHYYSNHPNLGSAKARNVGIENARGDYITFLDDDDIYLPEKVERQVTAMMEKNADYCITDLKLYDENEKCVDRRLRDYIDSNGSKRLHTLHLMHHMTGTDTMMFRTEYLRRIGGFPPIDIGDEFYLMNEAITNGGCFFYLPGCDVKAYVRTTGGLSRGEGKIQGENELYQFKKRFFGVINRKSRRYIRMRHHAVLAFAGLRSRKIGFMLYEAIWAFMCEPIACIKLVLKRAS